MKKTNKNGPNFRMRIQDFIPITSDRNILIRTQIRGTLHAAMWSDDWLPIFTGRSAEAGLELTLWLTKELTKRQMSHLETQDAISA